MAYNLILWWARLFLRLYFRRTLVYGRRHIPKQGPLIVASNHPSAFMEASVLATVMGRHIHFMVRGDVFNPRFRWLFKWTKQIPIYRQKDGISNLRKNASSFELTYRKLGEGNAVLIFPEAKTALEKRLRPVQRGTAHLAFGTLPYINADDQLMLQPVGINFIDPRIPGTDVTVKFGSPFPIETGTRENREAIEVFTERLTEAMQPLIVQVDDPGAERHYDVLASIYLKSNRFSIRRETVHEALSGIAGMINHPEQHHELMMRLHDHVHLLKKTGQRELAFFPELSLMQRIWLPFILLLKCIWWLAGGWIWRCLRAVILNKMRTDTFQGPTSVGAAMVLFPVLQILLVIPALIFGWPWWIFPLWWAVMVMGKWIPESIGLIWNNLLMPVSLRKKINQDIKYFILELQSIK